MTLPSSKPDINMFDDGNITKAGSQQRTFRGYIIGKSIGIGGYGRVKLGQHIATKECCAIKIIPVKEGGDKMKAQEEILGEVEAMKRIHHTNVLAIKEFHLDTHFPRRVPGRFARAHVFILEWAGGGELFNYIALSGAFSEELARFYFRQTVQALISCHANGVFHRDIKPENLLLMEDLTTLKVCDFGLAALHDLQDSDKQLNTSQKGSATYIAPEVVRAGPVSAYDPAKSDVFSLGCTLYVMKVGYSPFYDQAFERAFSQDIKKFWAMHLSLAKRLSHAFSPSFLELIGALLHPDPRKRPTLKQIPSYAWYNMEIPSVPIVRAEMSQRACIIAKSKRADDFSDMLRKCDTFDPFTFPARRTAMTDDVESVEVPRGLLTAGGTYFAVLAQGVRPVIEEIECLLKDMDIKVNKASHCEYGVRLSATALVSKRSVAPPSHIDQSDILAVEDLLRSVLPNDSEENISHVSTSRTMINSLSVAPSKTLVFFHVHFFHTKVAQEIVVHFDRKQGEVESYLQLYTEVRDSFLQTADS